MFFEFRTRSRITREILARRNTGHSSARETKRTGTELSPAHLKEPMGFHRQKRWWNDSKKPVTQYFKSISGDRGLLKKERMAEIPYTSMRIHRTQNSHVCTTHSANELSIYGAVSSWCEEFGEKTQNQKRVDFGKGSWQKKNEQFLKNEKPQEVNSLVQTPRSDNPPSGNRLRECLQRFETLDKDIQFTKVCEDASFWRRVSIGMSYKTIPDVDDGLGDRTPACREYTLLRADSDSRIHATISRTNYNWTSSSSSYHTISWHQRN